VQKLTKSIEIEAAPEKVFAFTIDLDKMNEASKGFAELVKTSKGPLGVGSILHQVGQSGGSAAEVDCEITEFVENKKWAARTIGASKLKMDYSWNVEPTAKGTKLTYIMDYKLPYSIVGKLIDKLKVSKDMEKKIGNSIENIKKALEA
jgi:carbon monoxide dehydrogenase subunit G